MNLEFQKYPYPFKALFSISNDIDGLDFSTYIKLHRFLNTHNETEVGPGLGLDISDSFWFFSTKPPINDSFSYFEGLTSKKSKYADAIQMLTELGHLDALHTWGNFNQMGGFQRKYAELATNELIKWDRRPIVWTDHGDVHNLQNLGNGLGSQPFTNDGTGKTQETLEYHTDLFQKLGFTFMWCTDQTSPIWAHNRTLSRLEKWKYTGGIRNKFSSLVSNQKALFFPLLWKTDLKDKTPIYAFRRYLPNWQSTSTDHLETIFASNALDELERNESATILLTHFGFGSQFPNFSSKTISQLRELQKRNEAGTLGIFSTERLLTYIFVRDHMEATFYKNIINLSWKVHPPQGIVDRGDEVLHGLTLEIKNPEKYQIIFNEKVVPSKIFGGNFISVSTRKRNHFPYEELVSI